MLAPMQPSSQPSPPPSSQSFAGLLAALAVPANGAAAWGDEALEDDVLTLSYERALSNPARSKPADGGDRPAGAPTRIETLSAIATRPEPKPDQDAGTEAGAAAQTTAECERRAARLTIRLSHTESARLKQRAAEAGLTVSAYLRSCALEADLLRAQVKQALAEIRSGKTGTEGTRKQGAKGARPMRVLAHIGRLCIGLSAGK